MGRLKRTTSGNILFVLCSYRNMSSHVSPVLTFFVQVQLSQHELVRTAVSNMCVLLYHDVSHTTLHPSLSDMA